MSEKEASRRNFLQLLGLTAGAALVSTDALAGSIDLSEIRKLNDKQQNFILRYEKWIDEFLPVIRIQKTEPDNIENHKKMIVLTQKAEKFQPELAEHMKDETFSLVFRVSLGRMTKEI